MDVKPKLKPRIMKTSLMFGGLNKTFYIYNYVDLGKALDELFQATPPNIGLRLQVKSFDYLKDDHAKNVYKSYMSRQEESHESPKPEVAKDDISSAKDKVQGS